MKNILVVDSEVKLTKLDVYRLEEKLGINLPVEYKNFLLLHNGGHPEKDCYPAINTSLNGADIAWFYAFYDGEYENLLKEYSRFKDMVPEDFIPVARGSGGNEICLGVSGNVFGKVYFFIRNWELYENGQPVPDDMYTIANNFTDFINSLYSFDVEGEVNKDAVFSSSKYIYTHDKYSLPFSTEAKKYGELVTDFFTKAPATCEDYIIEEAKDSDEMSLHYDSADENKRYIRRISKSKETITEELVTKIPS